MGVEQRLKVIKGGSIGEGPRCATGDYQRCHRTASLGVRRDMASWLADLTKTSRSADVSLSEPSAAGQQPAGGVDQ